MNKSLLLILLLSCFGFSAQTYCIPTFNSGCSDGDQIDSFTISSIGFNHLNTGCSGNAYGDYTAQTIILSAGVNYSFEITHGFSNQFVKIWIDFNNDGIFTDASPELVASAVSTSVSGIDTTLGLINVPTGATIGVHRMRVADSYSSDPIPCNVDGFGEVHDYTVNITAAPSCIAPTDLSINTITSTSANLSWVASSSVPSIGYEYYLSTNSAYPTSSTIATGSSANGVVTTTLPIVPSTSYYVWVRSVCSGSDKSAWSIPVAFTSSCAPITPNYTNNFTSFPGVCWQQASGGNITSGSTSTDVYWMEDGFLNVNYSGAAKINLFYQNRAGWLKTPVFNLLAGGYRVKFDYGITDYDETTISAMGSDDIVQFAISNDGGSTWSVLQTWSISNSPSNTLNQFSLDLTSYNSANTVFAFYGSDGAIVDPEDYDFFVDNFVIEHSATLATNDNLKKNTNVVVYPNPFVDFLNVKNSDLVKSASITDFNGRVVKRFEDINTTLNMNEIISGAYLLVLKMKDGTQQIQKIIKK